MRRLCYLVLAIFFILSVGVEATEPALQLYNDVSSNAWYYESVMTVSEYDLMNGTGNNLFEPEGTLSLAEAITLSVRLHLSFSDEQVDFETSDRWYVPYVDYAREKGFLDDLYIYPTGAASFVTFPSSTMDNGWHVTRLQFAVLIAHAVPEDQLPEINSIEDLSITDVSPYWHEAEIGAVYKLYRAGILTGSDADGMFHGGDTIKRSEAATIISRVVKSSLRKRIELKCDTGFNPVTDEEAARLVSRQTSDPILKSFVADFDQDGVTEGFVVTGVEWDLFTPVTVWFISRGRADQLMIGHYSNTTADLTYGMDDLGEVVAFHYFCSYISYGANRIWKVEDGKPCIITLNNDRVEKADGYTEYDHEMARIAYDPITKGYVAKTAAMVYSEKEGQTERIDEYHLLQYNKELDALVWTYTERNGEWVRR